MPEITVDLAADLDWELPGFHITGYAYTEALQPYHLEVWVEKSTMDDVLLPLCRQYGVNLVTGLGFMSITSVVQLIRRVLRTGKPCRIFYISDFDPAGDGMPVAVARQIEYWLHHYGLDLDVKLEPIALTRDQVIAYRLPRIPIKESDRRKANFEERYGEGAVELDALEALHPGELVRLVAEHILRYRDPTLPRKLTAARQKAEEKLATVWGEYLSPYQNRLEELRDKVSGIVARYQTQLDELREALEADLEPYREELEALRQAVQSTIEQLEVDLPDTPEPETAPEEEGWLFDSQRDYFEQLAAYKSWRNGDGKKAEEVEA